MTDSISQQASWHPLEAGARAPTDPPGSSSESIGAASAAVAIRNVLTRLKLRATYPPACSREVDEWLAAPGIDDPSLLDLEHLPFVTIDNEDSRDLDQALYIEAGSAETLHLYYALADASWFVRPGTALFAEALQRGVTIYTPAGSLPMLPTALSEGLISLNPEVARRALVFVIVINPDGKVVSTEVERARIRSRAKLSYHSVQQFYDAIGTDQAHAYASRPWADSLRLLSEFGQRRLRLAAERDVIDYDRREPTIRLDVATDRLVIELRRRLDSERYNEQVSLLCNIEGARLLQEHSDVPTLQSIFRVHESPLRSNLAKLRATLAQLVETQTLDQQWRWKETEALADYAEQLPRNEATRRLRQAVERQLLMANRASLFSPEPGRHHALGVDVYARFTSPMREIVGIFTHKELLEALGKTNGKQGSLRHASDDSELRDRVITTANESKKLYRQLEKSFELLALDDHLQPDLQLLPVQRPEHPGTVVGISRGKVHVNLDKTGTDVKIYLSDLEKITGTEYSVTDTAAIPGNSSANPKEFASAPILKLGAAVTLQTFHYDAERKRYSFNVQVSH